MASIFSASSSKYTLEFSNLEILNSIWWIKPFTYCFTKTRFAKNGDKFSKYKNDLYLDLDIVNIVQNLNEIHKSHKMSKLENISNLI